MQEFLKQAKCTTEDTEKNRGHREDVGFHKKPNNRTSTKIKILVKKTRFVISVLAEDAKENFAADPLPAPRQAGAGGTGDAALTSEGYSPARPVCVRGPPRDCVVERYEQSMR